MSDTTIKIHKTVETDGTHVPSFTLKLCVTAASGITPCIFVHEYHPKNPYSEARFDFTNVAYYDELSEVADYLQYRNKFCLIRKSELEKRFANKETLDQFLATVSQDIQRLIQQIDTTTATGECEDLTFTAETVHTETAICVSEDRDESAAAHQEQPPADTIILSFDGK